LIALQLLTHLCSYSTMRQWWASPDNMYSEPQ
jgi:hypothetical protein